VLREFLDHLAPDDDVLKSGVKLEKDQRRPTMKQKAIFIMEGVALGKLGVRPLSTPWKQSKIASAC
jgi:hypothetical protein